MSQIFIPFSIWESDFPRQANARRPSGYIEETYIETRPPPPPYPEVHPEELQMMQTLFDTYHRVVPSQYPWSHFISCSTKGFRRRNADVWSLRDCVLALPLAERRCLTQMHGRDASDPKNEQLFLGAPSRFKKSQVVAFEAIRNLPCAYARVAPNMFKKPALAYLAVNQDPMLYSYVQGTLRYSRAFAHPIFRRNGLALSVAPGKMRRDPSSVAESVMQNGMALEFAEKEARHSDSIALLAIKQNKKAMRFTTAAHHSSPTFFERIVKYDPRLVHEFPPHIAQNPGRWKQAVAFNPDAFMYAISDVQADRAYVLDLMRTQGKYFRWAAQPLHADLELCFASVSSYGEALAWVDETVLYNFTLNLAAVTQMGMALQYSPYKASWAVVKEAALQDPRSIVFADPSLFFIADVQKFFEPIFKKLEREAQELIGPKLANLPVDQLPFVPFDSSLSPLSRGSHGRHKDEQVSLLPADL